MAAVDLAAASTRTVSDWLVRAALVSPERMHSAELQSAQTGIAAEQLLVDRGQVTRWEVYTACGAVRKPVAIQSVDDLPEWSDVLNDEGGAFGLTQRDRRVAIVGPVQGQATKAKACFVVTTKDYQGTNQFAGAIAAAIKGGYSIAHTLVAEKQDVLDVLYRLWDERRGSKKGASSVEESSDLQREFDNIAHAAFLLGASDIHITAARGRGTVYVRVHGELEKFGTEKTEEWAESLCSTIYNTLPERGSTKEGFNPRVTQDAVIERVFPEGMVRFRYSGLPQAPSGFDVTLRIIPIGVGAKRKSLASLGYSPDQCDSITRIFGRSSGMILIAGTTGSGKSTTLANVLMQMAVDRPGKKIRTVEEPVEFRIEGAYQTPVTRIKGDKSDFLVVLRALMRADPDIIMVGEIRDQDTADLAIQAVRSGHLCVSTIHADGAPICYDRLIGMGIPRLDLASVGLVAGLIYQKLVPVLCDGCKRPATGAWADAHEALQGTLARTMHITGGSLDGIYLRNESGCNDCEHRGITRRTVCAEILRPTSRMLKAVSEGDSRTIWEQWRHEIDPAKPELMRGRTAFEHGIWKMRTGMVSPVDVESEFRPLDESPFE